MCLENPLIDCSIVVVVASSYLGPGSIPRGAKCIFLVATDLAYKSNAAEEHSLEYLRTFLRMLVTFPRIFDDIPRNVLRHSLECLGTFPRMFEDIPRNVQHSPECLMTFPRIFGDIPRNVWRHSPEYNIPPIPRVPRIPFPVPVFLVLYIARFSLFFYC